MKRVHVSRVLTGPAFYGTLVPGTLPFRCCSLQKVLPQGPLLHSGVLPLSSPSVWWVTPCEFPYSPVPPLPRPKLPQSPNTAGLSAHSAQPLQPGTGRILIPPDVNGPELNIMPPPSPIPAPTSGAGKQS